MSTSPRIEQIDVLRGVSILLVLLHHFNIAYRLDDTILSVPFGWSAVNAVCRNGNYAVTMFFVISGFLITTNAQRRWLDLSQIRLAAFYRFRAARILPCVLLLLLAVDALAAMRIEIFENRSEFGGPVPLWIADLASLSFWMNVLMSRFGWFNYVLCVQWSLSIEEVFYLAFPLLCLLLRKERLLLLAWSTFILIGPVWRELHQGSEYLELNAYLACFDGLAFGCCTALLARHVRWPIGSARPIQLIAALAMTWFYLSNSIRVTAIYGVTVMAFGTAILLFAQAHAATTSIPRILRPLSRCGQLSYELYLFHLVVLGALRTGWHPGSTTGNAKIVLLASFLLLSIALAAIISRWFSEPLNRRLRVGPLFAGRRKPARRPLDIADR